MSNKTNNTLPLNADGNPEYDSILIQIDGRIPQRGVHHIDKLVASTQAPEETLDKLFTYYKEEYIREMETTADIIGRGFNSYSVYLYINKAGVASLVLSSDTFNYLVQNESIGNGSSLMAVDCLKGCLSELVSKWATLGNEIPPLSLMSFGDKVASKPQGENQVIDANEEVLEAAADIDKVCSTDTETLARNLTDVEKIAMIEQLRNQATIIESTMLRSE